MRYIVRRRFSLRTDPVFLAENGDLRYRVVHSLAGLGFKMTVKDGAGNAVITMRHRGHGEWEVSEDNKFFARIYQDGIVTSERKTINMTSNLFATHLEFTNQGSAVAILTRPFLKHPFSAHTELNVLNPQFERTAVVGSIAALNTRHGLWDGSTDTVHAVN